MKLIKKVIGKFKQEPNSKIIISFLDQRPKMYSYLLNDDYRGAKSFKKTKLMKIL